MYCPISKNFQTFLIWHELPFFAIFEPKAILTLYIVDWPQERKSQYIVKLTKALPEIQFLLDAIEVFEQFTSTIAKYESFACTFKIVFFSLV